MFISYQIYLINLFFYVSYLCVLWMVYFLQINENNKARSVQYYSTYTLDAQMFFIDVMMWDDVRWW